MTMNCELALKHIEQFLEDLDLDHHIWNTGKMQPGTNPVRQRLLEACG